MNVVHLTASTFFGGPERQMLGLAGQLAPRCRTVFLSFAEGGRCQALLEAARVEGHEAHALRHDTPWLRAAARELTGLLRRSGADVLFCHGYKANLVGRIAARRRDIPVVAVSRGWTAENLKVRLYEWLDRWHLRWMDRVVCVSEGQARKVKKAGVDPARIVVVRNAVDISRFADVDLRCCQWLHDLFPRPRRAVVGAAGRLSPEKGFDVYLEAAARIAESDRSIGFVHFGDGPERDRLEKRIRSANLGDVFVLTGHRTDLDRYLPFLDLMVLPSYTEGLPNVVLEAFAAGVPVVASAVGGTPEVVEDGVSGYLVPPGDPDILAQRILDVLASEERRKAMGRCGRQRVREQFTFAAQARAYERLIGELLPGRLPAAPARTAPTEKTAA
jgi:glycosyltransferase involved in cell wall biosynthesis